MRRAGIRVIPKIDEPIVRLARLASDRRWHLRKAVARDPATSASGEISYLVPDEETYIVLRDDLFVGFSYFVIGGAAQDRIAEWIRSEFDARTPPELLAWWDRGVTNRDVDDQVDAVLLLGVDSPETPREDYAERIRAALLDDNKDVRNAGIAAAGYTEWRVFRPEIEQMAASDPDPTARDRAGLLLKAWATQDQEASA